MNIISICFLNYIAKKPNLSLGEYNNTYPSRSFMYLDKEDLLHRDNGPAEIYYREYNDEDGMFWYKHNVLHRADGPAYYVDFNSGQYQVINYAYEGEVFEDRTAFEEYKDEKSKGL